MIEVVQLFVYVCIFVPFYSQRVFKFIIEDSKQAMIEATLKIPKPSDSLLTNKAELVVSTLYGQYNLNSEWKDLDKEVKNIKVTLQTPKVKRKKIFLVS